jgi:hypothetical protein
VGGIGSGRRPSYSGKDTTEDSLPLDIRRLRRAGALNPGRAVSWQWTLNDRVYASIQIRADDWEVTLTYLHTPRGGAAESIRQTVRLETTLCALGGRREWFTCPGCSRRVAVIYGVGRLFACRRCKGLAYSCQAESADDRAARRADRLRKKLGWEPGILNGNGGKPKGMRWCTYERLMAQHDAFVGVSLAVMARKLGLLRGQLEDIEDAVTSWR